MSPLTLARMLYRTLPLGLRARLRWLTHPILMAALARGLPPLDPALRQPTSAAIVAGLLSTPHGVGVAARLCALELEAAGVRTRLHDLSAALDAPQEGATPASAAPADGEALILHVNPPALLHALTALPRRDLERRRIGYWVWELERAPDSWRQAGAHVHEIWAPSRFAADAIGAALPAHPVTVVPHPAALAPPRLTPAARDAVRARLGAAADEFLALTSFSMSSGFARKNPLAAIAAFRDAFGPADKARLIVRCRDAAIYPAGLAQLHAAAREANGRVLLLDQPGDAATLADLYAACDAYISLHRSEGFGLNLAEAMLAERAVIATAWSGNLDFMDETAAALVPAQLIAVADPQRIYRLPGARWAEPDHDAAIDLLRTLAHDPDARHTLAKRGADLARAKLGGGTAARALGVAHQP